MAINLYLAQKYAGPTLCVDPKVTSILAWGKMGAWFYRPIRT